MNPIRRWLFAIFIASLIFPAVTSAQTWPDKPVHMTMPFPPGTGPDIVMRTVSERLAKMWKQPVLVENKPGGNGFIAMSAAKRAPADGYTLVMVDYGIMTVLPYLFPKTIPYDPVKDFDAVAPMYWAYWFVAVAGDSRFTKIPDLVAEANAKNGTMTYGSSGVGSPMHLQAAMLENATGTHMSHIPYKETPQVLIDISRHDIGWAFTTGATGGGMAKGGKIKFLAVASPKRHPGFPDVPTMAEAGGPKDFDLRTWVGLYAPHGVPKPILDKISADVATVLSDPEVKDLLVANGLEAWPGPASELVKQQAEDSKKYGELTSKLKISLD